MILFNTYILPILLGILTVIFIYIIKFIVFHKIIPYYYEYLSRGYSISGTWESDLTSRTNPVLKCSELISVTQLSNKIYGDIVYTEYDSSKNCITMQKQFKFEGLYLDSICSATYWNVDRSKLGRGTFCLVVQDDFTLTGKYIRFDHEKREIISDDYSWEKKTK